MKLCDCGKPARGGRGLCVNHWAVYKRKQVAYGRWNPDRVDSTETRNHLAALRAAGMGLRRIEKLTALSRPTLQSIPRVGFVTRNTRDKIAAIPIPAAPFDPVLAPGTQISAVGSARRLRALTRIGWPAEILAARLGVNRHRVQRITSGGQPRITAAYAEAIAGLFASLHMTPGPSRKCARVAELKGWPFPLAWDEDTIDDPAAQPFVAARTGRPAPLHVQIADLQSIGVQERTRLAELLHTSVDHVDRTLARIKEAS